MPRHFSEFKQVTIVVEGTSKPASVGIGPNRPKWSCLL